MLLGSSVQVSLGEQRIPGLLFDMRNVSLLSAGESATDVGLLGTEVPVGSQNVSVLCEQDGKQNRDGQ